MWLITLYPSGCLLAGSDQVNAHRHLLRAQCFPAGSNHLYLDNRSGWGYYSTKEVNILSSAKETRFGPLDSAN